MHNFLRFVYSKRFSELGSLVFDPYDYARVVTRLQSVENPSEAVLTDVLSSHLVVAIKIAIGQMRWKDLSPADRATVDKTSRFILDLFEDRGRVGFL